MVSELLYWANYVYRSGHNFRSRESSQERFVSWGTNLQVRTLSFALKLSSGFYSLFVSISSATSFLIFIELSLDFPRAAHLLLLRITLPFFLSFCHCLVGWRANAKEHTFISILVYRLLLRLVARFFGLSCGLGRSEFSLVAHKNKKIQKNPS